MKMGMFNMVVVAALAGARGFPAAVADIGVTLKPGKYVLTVTYEVQDLRQNQSRTATRCIARRDLDDPEKIFNDQTTAPPNQTETCSVKNLKNANGEISYDVDCSNRTVHVEGNLKDEGFSVVRTVMPKGSPTVILKFTLRGKRMGDCT